VRGPHRYANRIAGSRHSDGPTPLVRTVENWCPALHDRSQRESSFSRDHLSPTPRAAQVPRAESGAAALPRPRWRAATLRPETLLPSPHCGRGAGREGPSPALRAIKLSGILAVAAMTFYLLKPATLVSTIGMVLPSGWCCVELAQLRVPAVACKVSAGKPACCQRSCCQRRLPVQQSISSPPRFLEL
jgi:hypothetical protein